MSHRRVKAQVRVFDAKIMAVFLTYSLPTWAVLIATNTAPNLLWSSEANGV